MKWQYAQRRSHKESLHLSDELPVGYPPIIRRKRSWVGSRGVKELELGKRGTGVLWTVTLIWLHIHVWSGTIVSHWLPLTHCHLVLHGHALGWQHRMVVTSHGAMATWRHIHGAVCHAELTGSRSLHWHMVRPRHLAVHLVLHVWCRRAPTHHSIWRHVVRAGRGWRATLTHPSRTHWHSLCGQCW